MKVTVRNLGVIKEAEVDLKPLTIFIGPNNAGKTWLAYAMSGIFGRYGLAKYTRAYIEEQIPKSYPPLDQAIEQILDEGNAKIDLVQFADMYGEAYFNDVAKLAPQWMQEFLGTELAAFENLEVHIHLAEIKAAFLEKVLGRSTENKLSVGRGKHGPLVTALKESGKRELYVYTSTERNITEKLPHRAIREFLVELVFLGLHTSIYDNVYTFPTERTTFITYPPHLGDPGKEIHISTELTQTDQRSKPIPWSVFHLLDTIVNLFQSGFTTREREAKKNSLVATYIQLARVLETQIFSGKVDFSTPEPDPRRVILFTSEKELLEIAVSSSMVKELAALVLYLRYLAEPDEWLIIDEPEMNLHPKVQAQIIEFLSMLVNAGLPVLVTTHSTYVVDHLNNLMKAAEQDNQETIRDKFYLQQTQAFISKNEVSIYLVDEGTTRNILDEDGLIHWDTFSDVSDQVSQLYFEI